AEALPDINNHRVIVWMTFDGPNGPYGPTAEIVRWTGGVTEYLTKDKADDWEPRINSTGQVAWYKANYKGCYGSNAVIQLLDDGNITDLGDGTDSNQQASINDAGQVVWTRFNFCDSTSEIMLYASGEIKQLSNG